MQRYRINYQWLIGVFVTSLVLAITAYFVWSWQVNRKAGYFLKIAEQAMAEEKPLETFTALRKYVQLRPKEQETRIRMAKAAIDVVKDNDLIREKRGEALGILENTVRTTGNAELRRELAEIVIGFRPQDAVGHFEELLAENPQDSELNGLLVRALFKAKNYQRATKLGFNLIGYDKQSEAFDPKTATLQGEPEVYALLASVLIEKDKDLELARRVIDQMVDANPESPLAHLRKSIFLSSVREDEEAAKSLDKAYELDPTDETILSQKGTVALQNENYEEAKDYFAIGLKEHPESVLFYRLMAQAEILLEQREAALKTLDEGINKFTKEQSITLVIYKIDLLLNEKDYPGMEREIKRLTQLNRPDMQPVIDYQKARILYDQKQWSVAAKELKRVRPLLLQSPSYQASAGAMLGASYQSLGVLDLALQAYETVLSDHPNHAFAKRGRDQILAQRQQSKPGKQGFGLDQLVDEMLELPEAEQDWDKVAELLEKVVAEKELTEASKLLMQAKILLKRGNFKDSRALIRQAADVATEEEELNIRYVAIMLLASDPNAGPAAALRQLDVLEKKFGVTLRSRAQRAGLLAVQNPEDVTEQLRLLATNLEDLSEAERLKLYRFIGLKFEQLGKFDESREFYEKVAALDPNNLPVRMHLFNSALQQRDDTAIQKAQEAVLDFVKDKNNANYLLTEVRRRLLNYGRGEIDQTELEKTRGLLDRALRQRPKWHELHVSYGHLLLLLNQDLDLALKHFDDALDHGPAKSNAVNIQVKLLVERGLYAEARERMERLREEVRRKALGRLEAVVLINTGDEEKGFAAAEELASQQSQNASTQVWFSRIAQSMDKLDTSAAALRRALEINPASPDNWLRLIGLYVEAKKFREIEDVIREAHLACDAEYLPLMTGKYFELLSRWQNAEDLYLTDYAERFDELPVARRIAEFYLLWSKKNDANLGKAAIYINRILKAANDGEAPMDNPHVAWARQRAASILFAQKDYQQSLKAERLLRQGTTNNVLNSVENELLTDILIARNDPKSLAQAQQLLSELYKNKRLHKKGGLQLARLHSKTNQWDKSQSLLLDLISNNPADLSVRATYIELLIDQGEYTSAERAIKRLGDLNEKNPNLVQLSARLYSEKGDQAQLKRLLGSLLPSNDLRGALNAAQLQQVLYVAQLAARYDAIELAEKLYEIHASRTGETFELTKFLAYHGDCGRAIELMKRLYPERTDDVVQLANRMISVRRDEIGDQYDEPVDRLINAALLEDPDSVTRQLARAEAFNMQEKHTESIATYEGILARDDLPARLRAAAKNNLGFQLGLLNERVDEAEQLINEAMETFGPVDDMLDTRAVVRIAQGRYELAMEDMQLALSVSNDPIKYYHLAKACIMADEGQTAMNAWEKAQELGFKKESLPQLERVDFEQIVQKIESFQSQSAL